MPRVRAPPRSRQQDRRRESEDSPQRRAAIPAPNPPSAPPSARQNRSLRKALSRRRGSRTSQLADKRPERALSDHPSRVLVGARPPVRRRLLCERAVNKSRLVTIRSTCIGIRSQAARRRRPDGGATMRARSTTVAASCVGADSLPPREPLQESPPFTLGFPHAAALAPRLHRPLV
jgi:hypothetical protein